MYLSGCTSLLGLFLREERVLLRRGSSFLREERVLLRREPPVLPPVSLLVFALGAFCTGFNADYEPFPVPGVNSRFTVGHSLLLPFPLVYDRFDKKGEIRRPCVEVRNGNNSPEQHECERITEITDRKSPLPGAITVGLVTDGGLAILAVLSGNHAEKTLSGSPENSSEQAHNPHINQRFCSKQTFSSPSTLLNNQE